MRDQLTSRPFNELNWAEKSAIIQWHDLDLFEEILDIVHGKDNPRYDKDKDYSILHNLIDIWTDDYDNSIEIVLRPDSPDLTDEQVMQILNLGFGQIYQSIGDKGTQIFWRASKNNSKEVWRFECKARKGDFDNLEQLTLKIKYKELQEEFEKYKKVCETFYASLQKK